jgi:hypothetical protein
VDQDMMVPPAKIFEIRHGRWAAVFAVAKVVGFAFPSGLVAAADLAGLGPDVDGVADLGGDVLAVSDVQDE